MGASNPVNNNVFDLVTAIIPDPGAGNNIDWTCPANARVEIIYIGFIFLTDVNAADRYITILSTTPAISQMMGASAVIQTAANTWGRAFTAGLPEEVDLSAVDRVITPLSTTFILEPGDHLETSVLNIQAGDTISSIITRYRQWIIA